MSIKCLIISNYASTPHNVRPEAEMVIGLKRRGLDIEVMTPAACEYAGRMAAAGIPIHDHLPRRKLSLASIRRIRAVLRSGRHQVLYLFNNPAIANGLQAARGLPVKIVTYRGQTGNIHRYDPFAYLTHLHPRVDRIVCVANAVRDDLRRVLWRPEKAVTIYKGHDIRWYAGVTAVDRNRLGVPPGHCLVVCVANNRPRKGVPVLLDAVERLPAGLPLRLLLIGGGMDSPAMRARIAGRPLEKRVGLLGHRDDVLGIVAAADIAVLPSLRREGLPKTVIEAMALGVPPIVTRSGGSAELVDEGRSGLVVPPGDAPALATAIERLAREPEARRQMGAAARDKLIRNFNIEDSIERHLALFRELAQPG